jgi:hypothetical protein
MPLAFQMKNCHFQNVMEFYIPYEFIFQWDIQSLFIYFLQIIFSLISWKNKNLYSPFIV